jgi:hypothetical protein
MNSQNLSNFPLPSSPIIGGCEVQLL